MKLAEALRERADLQKRTGQLQHRVNGSARHLEGETPEEDAGALVAEARDVIRKLAVLVNRINKTNAVTVISSGITLTEAIARRDMLHQMRTFLTAAADAACGDTRAGLMYGRRRASELREVSALPVAELRAEADALAAQHRELDVIIQQANWSTELL